MRLLYPDDPLDQRVPDTLFREEFEVARARGLPVSIFSFEEFERGRFSPKPRPISGEAILYRGWMLNLGGYDRLTQAIAELSARMIVSPAAYRAAHHLPAWYPLVSEFTAETRVLETDADLVAAMQGMDWPGYFVKDYVKSLSSGGGSLVQTPEDIARVVAGIKKYRGEVEGGVCVRRKEEYVAGSERRYFVAAGGAFSSADDVPAVVAACALRVASPFFSIDTALRKDGVTRVIEIGDGQVSDRKEWPAEKLVDVLERIRDP